MYKAKVKWNGNHYFTGEEVKEAKSRSEKTEPLGFSTMNLFLSFHSMEMEEKSGLRFMRIR